MLVSGWFHTYRVIGPGFHVGAPVVCPWELWAGGAHWDSPRSKFQHYLSGSNARSRTSGYFFLGDQSTNNKSIFLNGAVQVLCSVLRLVAASAVEAKLGALFHNAQEGKILRLTLEEMGHPQLPTPIHIDNTTAVGDRKSVV